MVQPINQAHLHIDTSKEPLLNEYTSFLTNIIRMINEKRISVPLNLVEIGKIFKMDLGQIANYLKIISTTFNLFTLVNKTESQSMVDKLFLAKPKASEIQKPSQSEAPGYQITTEELKIITDLYYISNLRPLPLDIVNANAVYKAILEKFPRFFQIANDMLQLTSCAKYFTEEFLKCKKIKADMPKSLTFTGKNTNFTLNID